MTSITSTCLTNVITHVPQLSLMSHGVHGVRGVHVCQRSTSQHMPSIAISHMPRFPVLRIPVLAGVGWDLEKTVNTICKHHWTSLKAKDSQPFSGTSGGNPVANIGSKAMHVHAPFLHGINVTSSYFFPSQAFSETL